MDIKQIVILVFILLIVVYLVINTFEKTSNLTKMAEAKKVQNIKAADLKNANNTSNFTYSMWIFVDDWNYLYGQEKIILDRSNGPTVVLGTKPNTLAVKMRYFDKDKSLPVGADGTGLGGKGSAKLNAATTAACTACAAGYTCACTSCSTGIPDGQTSVQAATAAAAALAAENALGRVNVCQIENIPIQKWVNIIVSLYGLSLDIYLDGKLVRTCVLPGVPQVNNSADINVTPNGGFSGWTTKFKYWSDASNPQEAYNIYKSGFGGSILGNAISKYRLQFSVLKDNVQQGSFQI
jgi:hypothetical protein